MEYYQVPLGFGMALSRNPQALNIYSAMTEDQKKAVLDRAREVQSETEMNQIVNAILQNRMH